MKFCLVFGQQIFSVYIPLKKVLCEFNNLYFDLFDFFFGKV